VTPEEKEKSRIPREGNTSGTIPITLSAGATMNLPGETEAGSAGRQPCRGITWLLIDPMLAAREPVLSRCTLTTRSKSSDDRPHALKIPAPQGRNLH
jgi:hypothetical protein